MQPSTDEIHTTDSLWSKGHHDRNGLYIANNIITLPKAYEFLGDMFEGNMINLGYIKLERTMAQW